MILSIHPPTPQRPKARSSRINFIMTGIPFRHLCVFASLLLTSLLLAAPIDAQSAEENIDDLMQELSDFLQADVTGSTLTPESLRTVPSAVTVFTHTQIQRMGLNTLKELMSLVPGFQSYRSIGSSLANPYSSRGRRIAIPASEILVIVDGQRIEEPRASGGVIMAPHFPLNYISRVEFIRGPGSAVYGSNAMMGVINIITRTNVDEIGVNLGSFNAKHAHLLKTYRMDELWLNFFANINIDDGEKYTLFDKFNNEFTDTQDPKSIATFAIKANWRNTYINLQHFESKSEDFYNLETSINDDVSESFAKLSSLSLRQEFDWQAVSSYLWLSYTHSSIDITAQASAPAILDLNFNDYREIRAQFHNNWHINQNNSLQFGVELRRIEAPSAFANLEIGSLTMTSTVQNESSRNIAGLYAQYQHQPSETSHLTLGLRYDSFSFIGSQFTPRVAFVQEISDHHSLKVLYGQAFRAPAESELHLVETPTSIGNPNLKPETVQTIDLIWVGQWSHTGFAVGYFENHFKNAIVKMPVSTTNSQREYLNKDQDPSKGVELELSHQMGQRLLLRGTYTQLIEAPNVTFYEAERFASLMANYQQTRWNANLTATWFSERASPVSGSPTITTDLDAYWLVAGKLTFSVNSDVKIFGQVKNIDDEDYLTPGAQPNRGREIMFGVNWEY